MLITLVMMSANVFADGLTATLQQGDKMTPFYGVDAFKDAYAAASDGAVITLSAGSFNVLSGKVEKSVKIVGNFALNASSVERTILSSLTVSADNVTIDGVYFSGNLTLGNISDCKISHSWVNGALTYTSGTDWHINTVVDQCVIKSDKAIKQGKNYTIKNSTINQFTEFNTSSNIAYISNCVIYTFVYNHSSPSSEGETYTPNIPFAIYKNNILGVDVTDYIFSGSGSSYHYYNIYFNGPSEFYSNIFPISHYKYGTSSYYVAGTSTTINFNAGCTNVGNITTDWSKCLTSGQYPSTPKDPGNGQDGTLRGPQGGTGFSLYPNIPRITSSTIDSSTDDEGKLNVSIKVEIPE